VARWQGFIQDGILRALGNVESSKESELRQQGNYEPPEVRWRILLRKHRDNGICVDCGAREPDWCSINLGCLLCLQCSGVHRSLGVSYSKVRSLTLDQLDPDVFALLLALGNAAVNSIYEAKVWSPAHAQIPPPLRKPSDGNDRATKEAWIQAKYIERRFLAATAPAASDFTSAADLLRLLAQGLDKNLVGEEGQTLLMQVL
jgi:Arf-GAP/coiled-coil/ANK repeat/PH domain-containing protein